MSVRYLIFIIFNIWPDQKEKMTRLPDKLSRYIDKLGGIRE